MPMNVSLTPQFAAMMQERVASGRYNNASEVVQQALRLLDDTGRRQHLRSLLAVSLEQASRGELVDFTPELEERIEREADEAYQRGDQPDPDVCP